jgi:hypothetical protein
VWVELGQDARNQRQTQRLAGLLGLRDSTLAAAHLTRLWAWAAELAPAGELTGLSPRAIARAAGWRGDPQTLLAALAGAGYLERRPGGTWLCGLPTELHGLRTETAPSGRAARYRQLEPPPLPSPPSGTRLHVHGLWEAALRELAGMVNHANFEAFLRDTIGLYQSGAWVTIGAPSLYVQEVLAQRFRTAIDRALFEVTGLPLHARLICLPPPPPSPA